MRLTKISIVAMALGVMAVSSNSYAAAKETHISHNDLPAAVQKAADELTTGATKVIYTKDDENGKIEYEVTVVTKGHKKDIAFDPNGTLIEIEETVAFDALPDAVKAGLKEQAKERKIGVVESITKKGAIVAYEAHLSGGGNKEIQVGPDGKLLDHEE